MTKLKWTQKVDTLDVNLRRAMGMHRCSKPMKLHEWTAGDYEIVRLTGSGGWKSYDVKFKGERLANVPRLDAAKKRAQEHAAKRELAGLDATLVAQATGGVVHLPPGRYNLDPARGTYERTSKLALDWKRRDDGQWNAECWCGSTLIGADTDGPQGRTKHEAWHAMRHFELAFNLRLRTINIAWEWIEANPGSQDRNAFRRYVNERLGGRSTL